MVQVDADGQHEVADAKRLVELVANGEADLVGGLPLRVRLQGVAHAPDRR